ncbi:MAG: hypothetical protein KKD36_09475 [Bacteroidetes bacterium]|nr:hypothetical protein [Bacteroidota bacterium]
MDDTKKKLIEGVALSLAFLLTSMFLYSYPEFIGNQIVTRSIGVVFGVLGIMFFLSQLTNIDFNNNKEIKSAISDISVGLVIGIIILLLLYFFSNWFVNLIVTILLLLTLFGVLRGIIIIISTIDFSKGNRLIKLPVIILNIAIFSLTILQLLQIFKVIDK